MPIYHLPPYNASAPPRLTGTESFYRPHFNLVKFVCKQLYAETAGLEVQFNSVVFTPNAAASTQIFKSAEQYFFDFVAPMTLKKLGWLSTVIIATEMKCLGPSVRDPPNLPYFSALVAFAKHHPTTDVRYQFVNFQFGPDNPYSCLHFL
jgi:hypothetical protein